jgi:hypothetical protein
MDRLAAPPLSEFLGVDTTGTVRVRLDRCGRGVRVGLGSGWRSVVGPERLGGAVLEALGAAALERLVAGPDVPDAAPAASGKAAPVTTPVTAPVVEGLRRAWQDLREFRLQLAALREATWTVPGLGRLVTVVLRSVQVVGVELDPTWRRTATDGELEHHIEHTLRAALQQCAARPERALYGCPDLAAVLTGGLPSGDLLTGCLPAGGRR